jgi:chemotaxis protein MotB
MKWYMMLIAGCCVALLFAGCVLTSDIGGPDNDALSSDWMASEEDRTIADLNHALDASRLEVARCRKESARLEGEIEKIDDRARIMGVQVDSLNQTIEKQAAIISLQKTIIRLFDDSQQTLQASIQEQIEAGDLASGASTQSIKYVLSNRLLFKPNGVELSSDGKVLLTRLTDVLLKPSYPYIRVLGHTDDRPLKSSARFADNWELSAARAVAVVRFFHEALGVSPERMTAVGCGQFLPLAANDTDEGRSRNRRIEIILEAGPPPAATVEIPSS